MKGGADIFTEPGKIAAKMKSAPGPRSFFKTAEERSIAEYFNGLYNDEKVVRAKERCRRQKILSAVRQIVVGIVLLVIGAIISPWLAPLSTLFAPAK